MKKKLVLNRETIRNLDEKDLDQVYGGIDITPRPDTCQQPMTVVFNGWGCAVTVPDSAVVSNCQSCVR